MKPGFIPGFFLSYNILMNKMKLLENMLLDDNYFKDLKVIKPSQIKITAKATRAPSIPEKASVGYNSTKRNFIDLERTNLIGIVGKSSNPSALLRLSNGKIIKLKVGQWFEGWRVFAIDRDKIHVENGFKQEILRMPG